MTSTTINKSDNTDNKNINSSENGIKERSGTLSIGGKIVASDILN